MSNLGVDHPRSSTPTFRSTRVYRTHHIDGAVVLRISTDGVARRTAGDYSVWLVVDPALGERLRELPTKTPVWMADTAENHERVERIRRERPSESHLDGVTTFTVDPRDTPEDFCIAHLPAIDIRHGEYSHDSPYSAINLPGVSITPRCSVRFVADCGGVQRVRDRPPCGDDAPFAGGENVVLTGHGVHPDGSGLGRGARQTGPPSRWRFDWTATRLSRLLAPAWPWLADWQVDHKPPGSTTGRLLGDSSNRRDLRQPT